MDLHIWVLSVAVYFRGLGFNMTRIKTTAIILIATAILIGCRESDQYRGINYSPRTKEALGSITISACYDYMPYPPEGYLSVCVFLDEEMTMPWRAFAGNNICWADKWIMKVPDRCWIVVFIDAEPVLPDDDGMVGLGPYPWEVRTEWDGLPDIGDPYHPEIIEHGNLMPLNATREVIDGDLVIHYELGDFDRSYRWGMS